MTDDRPLPQYGEYATPEQQAAAMGRTYVPPTPPPAPETRVNIAPPGSRVGAGAGEGSANQGMVLPGNAADRFATIFQIGIGIVFLINSDYFHFSQNINSAMADLGPTFRIAASIDHYAWLLLVANGIFLVLTALWAYHRIRHDKLAFFVPVIGYVAFNLFLGIVAGIVSR